MEEPVSLPHTTTLTETVNQRLTIDKHVISYDIRLKSFFLHSLQELIHFIHIQFFTRDVSQYVKRARVWMQLDPPHLFVNLPTFFYIIHLRQPIQKTVNSKNTR
ncbi:hypothetical protein MIMGU_mgv1a016869mg [Erythranthe guttata]|uniref:Uncharacterized protein n=1 Tax=Erythranthe guttata TaxID=4155 RepID=A0A022RIX7_ERYGU|nr:hypothetical protein MIMGU_mgv1a016869mg [Erythranthe guttata]